MKKDPLVIQSRVILGILILQYLFGMAVNLFIHFPNTKNENSLWEFAKGQWPIAIHILLGFGLFIGGLVLLIRAIRRKDRDWIIAGAVGFFWIIVAIVAGAQFVPTQQDIYSYIMASAFILAVIAYGWGIFKTRK